MKKQIFFAAFSILTIFILIPQTQGESQKLTKISGKNRSSTFKAGEEFRVNTYIHGVQDHPAIAMDDKGNLVINWYSWDSTHPYPGSGIYAQRFTKKGKIQGFNFRVDINIDYSCLPQAAAAMDRRGNFVVTWTSYELDGSSYGIFAKRYNKEGKVLGPEFQVNTYTYLSQSDPAIAMDSKGNFIITWESYGQDGSESGIFAQRFNRRGKPVDSEFQVNTYTSEEQYNPKIAMDEKGRFVITWASNYQDGSDFGIYARRYNKKGKAVGPEFKVNTYTLYSQNDPAIAMDSKGNFIITWESYGQDGSESGIFAQRFDKKGNPVGPEFQVNTYTTGFQWFPAIAMDIKGKFVIAWASDEQDGSGEGIFAQAFNRKGNTLGTEFQVNSYTAGTQWHPAIAMDLEGNFIITWESYGHADLDEGIYARMFRK